MTTGHASAAPLAEDNYLSAIFLAVLADSPEEIVRAFTLTSLAAKDADAVVTWLSAHGLGEIVWSALRQRDCLPSFTAWSKLSEAIQRRTARHLAQTAALTELGEIFAAAEISATATRAFGILQTLQPFMATRVGTDIDLLVPPAQFSAVCDRLRQSGFRAGVHPELFTRGIVTIDLATRPSKFICFTSLPEEARGFPGLDTNWEKFVRSGTLKGIQYFSPLFELLLGTLHYVYKHRFSRHGWGLDALILAGALSPSEQNTLATVAAQTRTIEYFFHLRKYLSAQIGTASASKIIPLPVTSLHPSSRLRSRLLSRGRRQMTRLQNLPKKTRQSMVDQGYLLAWLQCRDRTFRSKLIRQIFFPPPTPLRRESTRSKNVSTKISWWQRARRLGRAISRTFRALFG